MACALIDILKCSFQGTHDVSLNYEYEELRFDIFAEYHERGEKYVLSKKAQLWAVEADEYVFVKHLNYLSSEDANKYTSTLVDSLYKKVNPREDHMSSAVVLILLCDEMDSEVENLVKKFKYRKNYKFSLWGWADALFVVVDLNKRQVFNNKAAKHIAEVVKSNLERV